MIKDINLPSFNCSARFQFYWLFFNEETKISLSFTQLSEKKNDFYKRDIEDSWIQYQRKHADQLLGFKSRSLLNSQKSRIKGFWKIKCWYQDAGIVLIVSILWK